MNLSDQPAKRQLADLLGACNDDASPHILWVDNGGGVHVDPLPDGMMPNKFGDRPDLRFRYETFHTGHEYTGPKAAADSDFIGRLFVALVRDWNAGLIGYSDEWDAR